MRSVPEDWYFHHTDPRFCGDAHQCLYLGAAIKRNESKEDPKAKTKDIENPKSMSHRLEVPKMIPTSFMDVEEH